MFAATSERRAQREAVLTQLTQIPTAAGKEGRVHAFVERFLAKHRDALDIARDSAGNWLIRQARRAGAADRCTPVLYTAHLDHPAFVVTQIHDARTVELEFRGGVNDPYFVGATIEIVAAGDARRIAKIESLDAQSTPFKKVRATLSAGSAAMMPTGGAPTDASPTVGIQPGDIARWHFPRAEVIDGCLHTDACDDLAAAAAALCVLEELLDLPAASHVGVLLTVAEEVGFLGAIHAARTEFVPRDALLVCLENSRSFPHDSPIGAGAILRVGDRLSVFTPNLTNRLTQVFVEQKKSDPTFRYQRKLMAGGACEATAFAAYGYQSTCLCLPLGNYHNMVDIDGVAAGSTPARVGREFIGLEDFHSLCAMLHVAALPLETTTVEPYDKLMERLYSERLFVLEINA